MAASRESGSPVFPAFYHEELVGVARGDQDHRLVDLQGDAALARGQLRQVAPAVARVVGQTANSGKGKNTKNAGF